MSTSATQPLRMSYRIGRGEQGVLTFEPYKSSLLPHWRFRTVAIARGSSAALWGKFLEYDHEDDFVGMVSNASEFTHPVSGSKSFVASFGSSSHLHVI